MFGCTTKYNSLSGKWNTKRSLRNKRIHKCLGYSFIILGQGAIFTGIYHYRHVDAHRYDTPYEWIQLGIFLGILIILEAIYQRSLAREVPLNGCNNLGLISLHRLKVWSEPRLWSKRSKRRAALLRQDLLFFIRPFLKLQNICCLFSCNFLYRFLNSFTFLYFVVCNDWLHAQWYIKRLSWFLTIIFYSIGQNCEITLFSLFGGIFN